MSEQARQRAREFVRRVERTQLAREAYERGLAAAADHIVWARVRAGQPITWEGRDLGRDFG